MLLQDSNIQLMITDLNMPGMDGFELTRKALEINPSLPIVLSTGAIANIAQTAENAGIKMIFNKPLYARQILASVMELLS